jgi:hypothetical protein
MPMTPRILAMTLLLGGCFPFPDEDASGAPSASRDASRFGNFREGATWKYEIHWIRSGTCSGDRIRTIRLTRVIPSAGGRLLVYAWADSALARDPSITFPALCDSVDTGWKSDSVRLDGGSEYVLPDAPRDPQGYGDLRLMSFFQTREIPTDTGVLCDGVTQRIRNVAFEGGARPEIIDTSACLNGAGDSASYARYLQGVGLVRKRWGYTDEGVRIDFTSIRLLEFAGRPAPE